MGFGWSEKHGVVSEQVRCLSAGTAEDPNVLRDPALKWLWRDLRAGDFLTCV